MARVWSDGKPKDKSTKIDTTGEQFDTKSKRFKIKTDKSMLLNASLAEFEASIYSAISSGTGLKKVSYNPLTDVTLSRIASEYKSKLQKNQIANKKTGELLAPQTKVHLFASIRKIEKFLADGGEDFNFSRFNASVERSKTKYNDFIASFKATLATLENNTICGHLNDVRSIIKTGCGWHDILLGDLISGMKVNRVEKDVVILDIDQCEYIINNYKEILATKCKSRLHKAFFQYWFAALILNARKADMMQWTVSNLYIGAEGMTWIKYQPQKTKASGKIIDVPVYSQDLIELFNNNAKKYKGKILPPLDRSQQAYMTTGMKMIAKKIPIFHREIQIMKKGEMIKVPMYKCIKLHQMRASGASQKVMMGIPESVAKSYTGHTHDSKSWTRYLKILNTSKARYAITLASSISGQRQKRSH